MIWETDVDINLVAKRLYKRLDKLNTWIYQKETLNPKPGIYT
jgi:hypothetical protein